MGALFNETMKFKERSLAAPPVYEFEDETEMVYDCLVCGHELSESDLDDLGCCPDCGECVVEVDNV